MMNADVAYKNSMTVIFIFENIQSAKFTISYLEKKLFKSGGGIDYIN